MCIIAHNFEFEYCSQYLYNITLFNKENTVNNMQTVRDNLKLTIANKEQHLKTLKEDLLCGDYVNRVVTTSTIEFLQINIDELKRILQDVEQCV